MNKFLTFFAAAFLASLAVVHASDSNKGPEVTYSTTTTTTTTTTSTSPTTNSETERVVTRDSTGMPLIIELGLREVHKVPEEIINALNAFVYNAFLKLSPPVIVTIDNSSNSSSTTVVTATTTTTTTASHASSSSSSSSSSNSSAAPTSTDADFFAVEVNKEQLESVIASFNEDMNALVMKVPEAFKELISGLVKESLESFIRTAAPLNSYYRNYQFTIPAGDGKNDLYKRAIDAITVTRDFIEPAYLKADDLFRDNHYFIKQADYKQAVLLARTSFELFDKQIKIVEKLFGAEFAQKIYDKTLYDSFNSDLQLMDVFYKGLDLFRSVFRDTDQDTKMMQPINQGIEACAAKQAEFLELLQQNMETVKSVKTDEKSDSIGLPYALGTFLEISASNSLKTVETNVIAAQAAFLKMLQEKKIKTEQDLTGFLAKEIPELMTKAGVADKDKVKEHLSTWLTGWYWAAAVGMPLKEYRHQRTLQDSLTDDIHKYSKVHAKHFKKMMKQAEAKADKPASQLAIYKAALAYQAGLVAVQKAFMSLGFFKMLPPRDLYNEQYVDLKATLTMEEEGQENATR